MLKVVAWLWRDEKYRFNSLFRYGPEHVNTLRNMVGRHLSMPHEFVCVCDDPTGIDPDIRIVPLWDDLRHMGGCYTRLRAFAPDMRDLIGERFVWIDVDCVVTGPLDPLFDRSEDFVMWRNGVGPTPYCGSMVMMTAGARSEVWEDFDPALSPQMGQGLGYVGTDQAWIAARLGTDEAVWTPKDGVLSRHHVSGGKLKRRAAQHRDLPANARIVFFHGPFSPCSPKTQARHPWIVEHWK